MPARPNIIRSATIHFALPEDLHARLVLFLHSDVEGRVPKGAFQAFFSQRIREFFDARRLDLSQFGFPPGYHIFGNKSMIEALETRLKETSL